MQAIFFKIVGIAAVMLTTVIGGSMAHHLAWGMGSRPPAAGMTAADSAIVAALDPDFDGIACEEVM